MTANSVPEDIRGGDIIVARHRHILTSLETPTTTSDHGGLQVAYFSFSSYRVVPLEITLRLELTDKDRRAKVEVTLRGEELEEMGVRTFSDLRSFKFGKLQGRYFRAMLPTFAATKGDPVAEWKEGQRCITFLNTGVLGLTAMDEGPG